MVVLACATNKNVPECTHRPGGTVVSDSNRKPTAENSETGVKDFLKDVSDENLASIVMYADPEKVTRGLK